MSTAAQVQTAHDRTGVPVVLLASLRLGVLEAALVLLFALTSRYLAGPVEVIIEALLIIGGIVAVSFLPGVWTRARTIEGIAGAAGIGLGAAFTFMIVDVAALQPFGIYSQRWYGIGGGSNWWYHPIWWMAGAFAAWMGAVILAAQADRGKVSVVAGAIQVALLTLVVGAIASALHFPGAAWGLGTFAVSAMVALTLAAAAAALRRPGS